jgi:uncharacterized lipoprotein YajG
VLLELESSPLRRALLPADYRVEMRRLLRATSLTLLIAVALLLAGCGTPAVVKPSANPLPGLTHDVQSARSVAKQLQQAQNAETGATSP